LVKINVSRLLAVFSIALALLNLAMLACFISENARLREAIEAERSLYEETSRLCAEERSRYEELYKVLMVILEENEEIKEIFMSLNGNVVVPQNYTAILEREGP